VGRDRQKGKNVYRLKNLIKFLQISIHDVVEIDGQEYTITGITKNKVVLKNKYNNKLIKNYSYFFSENINRKTDEV
jgi:NMD protein affecting ribosome stability and mRNA decay